MFWWQVTKYDPLNRNEKGHYLKDEWTSSSDIGTIYEGKKFDSIEYKRVEDSYAYAVNNFLESTNTKYLTVTELQINTFRRKKTEYTKEMLNLYKNVKKGDLIAQKDIEIMVRLSLRENIWCMLESEKIRIHFGYDYYMFIGTNDFPPLELLEKIEEKKLFVERIPCSPLCSDEEYESVMKSMGQEV